MAAQGSDPATSAVAVVPSDVSAVTSIPNGKCRALYVGVTGNITLRTDDDDSDVLFSNVPVGVFPVNAYWVKATGTTATNIVALY